MAKKKPQNPTPEPQTPTGASDDPEWEGIINGALADAEELERVCHGGGPDPRVVADLAVVRVLRELGGVVLSVRPAPGPDLAQQHVDRATGPDSGALLEQLRATEHALKLEAQRRRDLVRLLVDVAEQLDTRTEALPGLLAQVKAWRETLPSKQEVGA